MDPWIVIFCIIAAIFAVFSITYVIFSIIRELGRRAEQTAEKKKEVKVQQATEVNNAHVVPAMMCGALFAASGLLTWAILSREKAPKKEKEAAAPKAPRLKKRGKSKRGINDFWWLISR